MAALQSTRLARAGCAVLQIDLFGCGDSSGDFADAEWEIWKKDVRAACAWLRGCVGGPIDLWGLRLGASLAADLCTDASLAIDRLLLWQPVTNGEQFLTQFLRLRLAAEMLAEGSAQSGTGKLRATLRAGHSLEIAGYELAPSLAGGIESLRLGGILPAAKDVTWLEISMTGANVLPASQRTLDAWREKGVRVNAAAVPGEPFWSTIEIAECEELLLATTEAMRP